MKRQTAILLIFVAGCDLVAKPTHDETTWIKKHEELPYVWEKHDESTVQARCSFRLQHRNNACAIRLQQGVFGPYCLIISALTEKEAEKLYLYSPTGAVRTLDGKPETLAAHEKKHCRGYDHGEFK